MDQLSTVCATRLYTALERDLTWRADRHIPLDKTFVQRSMRNNIRALEMMSDENEIFLDRVLDVHLLQKGGGPLRRFELLDALRIQGDREGA